ncbi:MULTISPECIES: hypothetical protein [unclassified Flavobacterium]|uniref:hypothetical protein n=1 Tax=unclassified Flavobacterium TaxID=196869 RepID=UPI00131E8D7D|nr:MULTISPECIES: hypothetical protein [unclassified Flavobacterium]
MKKLSLIIVILINSICLGQQTCEEMTVTNDEVTEKTTISSETLNFEKFSLTVIAGTRKGSYPKIIFKTREGCIDDYQPIYILFENEKRIKTANYVFQYNCDGYTGLIINNGTNEKLLRNEIIKTIRIDTRTTFYQIDITKEDAETIRKTVECAFNRKSWEDKIKYKGNW